MPYRRRPYLDEPAGGGAFNGGGGSTRNNNIQIASSPKRKREPSPGNSPDRREGNSMAAPPMQSRPIDVPPGMRPFSGPVPQQPMLSPGMVARRPPPDGMEQDGGQKLGVPSTELDEDYDDEEEDEEADEDEEEMEK